MLGCLPVAGDGPLSGSQPDLPAADRVVQGGLDTVLGIRRRVRLGPEIPHRPGVPAEFQRDQVIFLVTSGAAAAVITVLADSPRA